jgi:hypothetical protein
MDPHRKTLNMTNTLAYSWPASVTDKKVLKRCDLLQSLFFVYFLLEIGGQLQSLRELLLADIKLLKKTWKIKAWVKLSTVRMDMCVCITAKYHRCN